MRATSRCRPAMRRPVSMRPIPTIRCRAESEGDRPRWLEGYSWRGLTSGSPLQALWVFLAPFALANTAAAMRPPVDRASRWRFVARFHAAHGARVRAVARV